jgi:hypothetical protein
LLLFGQHENARSVVAKHQTVYVCFFSFHVLLQVRVKYSQSYRYAFMTIVTDVVLGRKERNDNENQKKESVNCSRLNRNTQAVL